jgi:hypothetical protein
MATAVYVHIGAPKSGSTYIQGRLHASREELAGGGLLVPAAHADHFRLMMHATGRDDSLRRPEAGRLAWDRVFGEISEWPGAAVISHEMLCIASAAQVRAVVDAAAPAEVHVVYTVRDLARTLPSEWQQAVRGGLTLGFDSYVRQVRDRASDAEAFEAAHDVVAVLARWRADLPPAQVHVVTVPPPGSVRDVLWQRFAQVVGVAPGIGGETGGRANESLGAVEAELLRRVNAAIRDVMGDDPALVQWTRRNIALDLLARRRDQQRFALRPDDFAWVVERAHQTVDALKASEYDVVGDLVELVPVPPPEPGPHPDDVHTNELVDAAVETIAGLAAALRQAQGGPASPKSGTEAPGPDA